MSDKIRPTHLERAAFVYVRQSKMHQVRMHRESRRRQYALEERARQLGFQDVVVIDEDVGRSGTGSQERPGFGRLLATVCDGKVGAVLALEASRLARNNRDWHHLVDLCALTETLVIDDDGVYDPRLLNDRLVLGLKGSMAEFELGLLRQRAQEALRQMIARGECLWEVPVGYVRTENNRIEMVPDRQVQNAIHSVFAKFRELGSARQVLLWFVREQVPFPHANRGGNDLQVVWKIPTYKRVHAVLTNPTYAGAFFHGRTKSRTMMDEGRARKTAGHHVPIDEWQVLIHDHHAAYISWEEFLQIRTQLESNAGMHSSYKRGAAKRGPALLQGLLRCARCGRKLRVAYAGTGGRVVRYICSDSHINRGQDKCISFGGLRVDEAVSNAVLEAVQPSGVQAAIHAWELIAQRKDEKRTLLQLALEKARYEAQRAQRQYDAVDPENRLVAAELELRWNQALQQAGDLEQRFQDHLKEQENLDEGLRVRLFQLGDDLETAWRHPEASIPLKKRILRTVLNEIVVDVADDPPQTLLRLHWAGGVHTQLQVRKNATGKHSRCTDRQVVELVRELAKVCADPAIASILNRHGYTTGAGNAWVESRVASVRRQHQIPAMSNDQERSWLTLQQAAAELGVHHSVVRKLIDRGILPASQVIPHAPWVIERNNLQLPAAQSVLHTASQGRRARLPAQDQQELPFV